MVMQGYLFYPHFRIIIGLGLGCCFAIDVAKRAQGGHQFVELWRSIDFIFGNTFLGVIF